MQPMPRTLEISETDRLHPAPLVSVYMLTYGHRAYIEQAVASVVGQRCDFPIELIVGEDCSPDGTLDVLRRLQQAHPDVIRILTAETNVGGRANAKRCVAAARGKYVAICEGDDYWTDPSKLACQIALMQRMPEVSLSCHAVALDDAMHPGAAPRIHRVAHRSRLLSQSEVVLGDGGLVPTCSMVIRADVMQDRPAWWEDCPVGDYPLLLRASLLGRVAYIDDVMGAYRINVPGSWSKRQQPELASRARHAEQIQQMLAGFARDAGSSVARDVSRVSSKYSFDAIVRTQGTTQARRELLVRKQSGMRFADRAVAALSVLTGRNLGWMRTASKRLAGRARAWRYDATQPQLRMDDHAS